MMSHTMKRIKDPVNVSYQNNSNLSVIENMKKRNDEKEFASNKTTNGSINSMYTVSTGNLSRQSEDVAQIVNEEERGRKYTNTLKNGKSLEHSNEQLSEERNVDKKGLSSKTIDIQRNGLNLTNVHKNIEISRNNNFKTKFNVDLHMNNESIFGDTKMDTNGIESVNIDANNYPAIPDRDKYFKSNEPGRKDYYIDSDRQKLDNAAYHSNGSTRARSKDSRFQENKHTEEVSYKTARLKANEHTVESRQNNNEGLLEDSDFLANNHKVEPRHNNNEATPIRQKLTVSKAKHEIRTNVTAQYNFQPKGGIQLHDQPNERSSWFDGNSVRSRQDDADLHINREDSKPHKNGKKPEYCIGSIISSRVPDIEAGLRYEQKTTDRTAKICLECDYCNPRGRREVSQMQVIEPTISKTCCTEFRPQSQLHGLQNGTLCFDDTQTKCLAFAKTAESPKTVLKTCGYPSPICTSLCPLTNTLYSISMNGNGNSSFYCYDAMETEPTIMFVKDIKNVVCMAFHENIGIIILSNLWGYTSRNKQCITIYTKQGITRRSETRRSKCKHRNLSICQETEHLALSGGYKVEVLNKNLQEVSTHTMSSSRWKSFRKFGWGMLFQRLKSSAKFDKYGNLVICSNRSDKIRVVSANTGICIRKLLIKGYQFNLFDFSKDNEIIVFVNDQQKCIYIKYLGIVATLNLELKIQNLVNDMEQMRIAFNIQDEKIMILEKENAALNERISRV